MTQQSHNPTARMTRRATLATGASIAAAAALRHRFNADAQEATPGVPASAASAPMMGFDIYVAGLHCAKEDPQMQMVAHHYCKKTPEGVFQCAIFDGNTETAKLIGLEYIIDETTFQSLPVEEHPYWHPHNYEVFSGQLVAPTLASDEELALMQTLLNSYGKTWHAWHTGRPDGEGEPGDPVPMGEAMLQWSFNHDGEADQSLVDTFSTGLDYDPMEKRTEREQFVDMAHPQEGVDALEGAFPGVTDEHLPGVEDAGDLNATPTS